MADARMTLNSTIFALVDANEEAVYTYVNNNPAQTEAQIVTGTGLNALIIEYILRILAAQTLLKSARNQLGESRWYTVGAWATLLINNLANARTWIASNDNANVSDMADSLSIAEEVAWALAQMMQSEKRITMVGVTPE